MDLHGDDLEAAYFLAHRFVDPMKAAGRPVNRLIESFCRKVDLCWEMSANGPEIQDGRAQSEASYNTAEAASKLAVTDAHVRRLARNGDIEAQKHGRDWLIPERSIDDYSERRRNGRTA
ncbi:helix-turn-helix domain-containing protein [Mycobacterium sp. E3251]|uniref:helix-turn-helix domain-containing protein n=1 Tax=Mycobacterium sp. E3251 TaxID=1834144 RepID=UPI0018D3BF2A|nr:helix-turn-helix domain-containing protein [Mycobacterium sp. E3251]